MPATNYTPIQLYRSTTSGNTPSAANMSAGEVALNIADNDMSMWMENASGTVKRFFNNPAALKYPTADGTSGQVIVTDGSGNLSFATPAGGALTNNVRQAVTSASTTTINLNSGNVIDLTMAASIATLSFTNVPASGTPILIQIVVKNASDGTAYTIAWPNSVYWSGQYAATTLSTVQTAPTLATGANGVTVIALLTTDGGTKWRGWVEATIPGGTEGILYSWGANTNGELGQNTTHLTSGYRSSPVQVGALTNWASFSGKNDFCVAIKTDGTLWSWGQGALGQLGQNSNVNRSSPVQVGALTSWASASAGILSVAAIKTDGTLWTWGNGSGGQLGQNDTTTRSSPVQVGALTNWSSASQGNYFCVAIKTDGTLWAWGLGTGGRLGQNSEVAQSSPVQVGALTNWASVSSSLGASCVAVKTNGTLWTWGVSNYGNLGQNSAANLSSPVQVGALTDWASASMSSFVCSAIKTDGTLWTWGLGSYGRLGQNNGTTRSSPVQVGALTDWASVSQGNNFCAAIKTNGTLWSWGRQDNTGALGLNDTVNRSSPVQVGALTNWGLVSAGLTFCVARTATTVNPA